MNLYAISAISIVFSFLFFLFPSSAFSKKLPVINGKEAVATVNGEPITLEEFNDVIASLHAGISEGKEVEAVNYSEIINRLINLRLILQEAKNMGINELPEIKNAVDIYKLNTLRDFLVEEQIKDIKADEEEVEKLYREAVKELKIKSVMFEKEDEAKKSGEEIRASNSPYDIMKRLVGEGLAKGSFEDTYLKYKDLLPAIAEAVSNMEIGSLSPVIQIEQGFVILKLEDIRFIENPEAREQARQAALRRKKAQAKGEYKKSLFNKYVKINEELIDSLDYSSMEEFQRLLKDNRIVAEIESDQPVRVGELTEALELKFFHGVAKDWQLKKINESKKVFLEEDLLPKRVFIKEALREGIDRTEAYKSMVKFYENSVIFDLFIKKVILPDIQLNEKELETYYKKSIKEYMLPEMIQISSLVFAERKVAEDAIAALRKGTDFKWLSSNAESQLNKDTRGVLKFDGDILTKESLPEDVREAVSGTDTGDFRLYASPEGYFYVLYIQNVFTSKPQSFEKVRDEIAEKVYNDKAKEAVKAYADKLREFYEVKIYGEGLKK